MAEQRMKQIDGVKVPLTEKEAADRLIEEAEQDAKTLDFITNHKYKEDRKSEYEMTNLTIGDQLDAIWKQLNVDRHGGKNLLPATDVVLDEILAIKVKYPKPQ